MHRTLIALAGIFIFVLLTVPAMAASDTVDATINVEAVWDIENYCSNHITFTINNGEYDNGYVYPTGDPSHIKVKSNKDYNVQIEYNCTGFPAGWHLWTREDNEVPNDHSLSYEILDTATGWYWTSDQGPTNMDDWYFFYMIDGIELADDWVGSHDMDIIYTLGNLP